MLADLPGQGYDPPKAWNSARKRLATEQKKLARQKKTAAHIADQYHNVMVEEHGVQFMIHNLRLAKLAADRTLAAPKKSQRSTLGPRCVPVINRRPGGGGYRQSGHCGMAVPKPLNEWVHRCPACGLEGDRDHVAANIAQFIAFGTERSARRSSGGRAASRQATEGSTGSRVKATESAGTSETLVKRRPHATSDQGHTTGGEPTMAGKTNLYRVKTSPVGACAATSGTTRRMPPT